MQGMVELALPSLPTPLWPQLSLQQVLIEHSFYAGSSGNPPSVPVTWLHYLISFPLPTSTQPLPLLLFTPSITCPLLLSAPQPLGFLGGSQHCRSSHMTALPMEWGCRIPSPSAGHCSVPPALLQPPFSPASSLCSSQG